MLTQAALATTALLATCTLPSGDLRDPHTWGNYFLDKYATERADAVANIEPGPQPLEHPRTVLLITGVTIPAVWFDPIKLRLERDGFRPVVYEPPDLLTGDLVENSQRLGDVVDQVRADTGEQRIDILAECTGGLIARYYIQALGGDAHVRRLVTFISPQHGVPKAAEAEPIAGWPALRDLTPGSDFLNAVNDAPLSPDVPVSSIYSCTDEYIQPFATSEIPGAHNIEVCDGYVGHFRFFYDPQLYILMHDELVAPAPTDGDADPSTDPGKADDSGASVASGSAGCSAGGTPGLATTLLVAGALLARRRRHSITRHRIAVDMRTCD
jgi:MYXO-CTERM domain-containing protein